MTAVHPAASLPQQRDPDSTSVHDPTKLVYEIVASGLLPAFDPLMTVKQRLLSPQQIVVYNSIFRKTATTLLLMYGLGFGARVIAIFYRASLGRVLAPISLVLQLPIVVPVILAIRWEYAQMLMSTFEFWFLLLNVTLWASSFALYVHDARAFVLPSCYVDFVNMLLIEAYFQNPRNVAVAGAMSASLMAALGVALSFRTIDDVRDSDVTTLGSSHALTLKDILVNTLATMVTITMRLVYRKYETIKRRNSDATTVATSTWVRSNGCRCRVKLRVKEQQQQSRRDALDSNSATPTLSLPHTPVGLIAVDTAHGTKWLLQMQFVSCATTFDATNTLQPFTQSHCNSRSVTTHYATWRAALLRLSGVAGFVLSGTALLLSSKSSECVSSNVHSVVATTGVALTLVFWLWFVCHTQRDLLRKLWTSFDFVFLDFQLVAASLSLCDVLRWQWQPCCGVLGCFVCMQGVLTTDAATPAVREQQLGWKTWYAAPVLLADMAVKAALVYTIVSTSDDDDDRRFQNRLLVNSTLDARHRVQFYVLPFFLSRQLTVFVWCIRLLYRVYSRQSEHELLLLLGNIEFNYERWKQMLMCRTPLSQTHTPASSQSSSGASSDVVASNMHATLRKIDDTPMSVVRDAELAPATSLVARVED